MNITETEYKALNKKVCPKSPKIKDFIGAFVIGGTICMIGQLLLGLYKYLKIEQELAKLLVPVSLIFLAAVLTACHLFDKIAKRAGAGTLVPITGFANAVVSPAIEFKNEGFILGVGAKMFAIAGPVIVYGLAASVVYGIVYWITTLF